MNKYINKFTDIISFLENNISITEKLFIDIDDIIRQFKEANNYIIEEYSDKNITAIITINDYIEQYYSDIIFDYCKSLNIDPIEFTEKIFNEIAIPLLYNYKPDSKSILIRLFDYCYQNGYNFTDLINEIISIQIENIIGIPRSVQKINIDLI